MANTIVFFLLSFLAVSINGAAITPATAPLGENVQQQIEGLLNHVQHLANNVSASLKSALPDNKQVLDGLVSNSQQFGHHVEGLIGKIQNEIDNNKGSLDDLLKQSLTNLHQVSVSFQNLIGPENSAKVTEIKTQLDNGLKSATVEVEKLAKAVQPNLQHTGEALQIFGKGIVDDFTKAVEKLKTQVNALSTGPK